MQAVQEAQTFKEVLQERAMEWVETTANALGIAAEHVYEILVRQMVIEGVVWTIMGVLSVVAAIILLRLFMKAFQEADAVEAKHDSAGQPIARCIIYGILGLVMGIAALIAVFSMIPESLMKLGNPEYYAIKELFEAMAGGK